MNETCPRLVFVLCAAIAGCGNSSTSVSAAACDPPCPDGTICDADTLDCVSGGDADADGDADTDADSDSDADTDTDTSADLSCEGLPEWTPADAAREEQMVGLINDLRASGTCFGAAFPPAAPLVMNDALRCASRKLAKHIGDTCDAGACEWSHCSGEPGVGFCQRFEEYGYGQNGGWAGNYMGSDVPQDTLDAWTDSPDGDDADALPDGCEIPMGDRWVDVGVGSWDGYFWAIGYALPGDQDCRDLVDTPGNGFDDDCDGVVD